VLALTSDEALAQHMLDLPHLTMQYPKFGKFSTRHNAHLGDGELVSLVCDLLLSEDVDPWSGEKIDLACVSNRAPKDQRPAVSNLLVLLDTTAAQGGLILT
jgi:hypothetical protein